MLDDVLRNMTLTVDGRGYAGNIEELVLPKLSLQTEEFRNGGMDAPVDIELGMEKLECEFTLTRFNRHSLTLFGVFSGETQLTARGAVVSDNGQTQAAVINMRGLVRELDMGTWKPGEKSTNKFMVSLRYYKLVLDEFPIYEIDIPNFLRKVNGVDQLAKMRAALGL
ncbi:phage major tail tube protein [Teredinibacter sp. KSP-S5-2]|uniref:phage major tail tube protein n=1 Tax=Teredinibacter sp. KSP-S5-2 TaxID=3034506 RepID=UPI0029346603|nr:phage major tail tube protein [Teredinibacter sp. KSP-S5-2]WNO10443.1 phage major tail tube protein [Teredinibacter sp. KSP-S5-2]